MVLERLELLRGIRISSSPPSSANRGLPTANSTGSFPGATGEQPDGREKLNMLANLLTSRKVIIKNWFEVR